MSIDLSITMPERDRRRLQDAMALYRDVLHKTAPQTVRATAGFIGRSLAASTKRSAKLRPVVENPNPRAATDGRMAKYGVFAYDGNRNKRFVPIYRTGEFGKIRFLNKKTAEWITIDRSTGKRVKQQMSTGTGEWDLPGIAQSPKRRIGRSGLAAASWRYLGSGRMGKVDFLVARGVRALNSREDHLRDVNPSIVLHNKIGYALDAFRTKGMRTVNTVGDRAARAMEREVLRKLTGIRLK